MIDKFLFKRCSTEVQLLLTRMKERPEDFNYGSGWRKLIETAEMSDNAYTKTERFMVLKYWDQCQADRKRNELLSTIMSETINPTKMDAPVKTQHMQNLMNMHQRIAASQYNAAQNLASNYASGYTDSRAMYGSALQGAKPCK
jgi:hypothetical protein